MNTTEIETADIIDVRDIIARVEELETVDFSDPNAPADQDEYENLVKLLAELKGMGGDEEWRGDWYPVTLIRDSYFQEYAQELAEDIGAISNDNQWPNYCIDWERAARELQIDYSSIEFDGVTYWTR